MNTSMDSMIWKTTHRFGAFMLALLLLFAAWEIAHDQELTSEVYRIGGASILGAVGLLALIKSVRAGGQKEAAPAASPRRARKARG
jgi:hypothetical protein